MRFTPVSRATCPFCRSANTMPIVYGMPSGELLESALRGEVALGGCCIDVGGDPDRVCRDCRFEWIGRAIGRPWSPYQD